MIYIIILMGSLSSCSYFQTRSPQSGFQTYHEDNQQIPGLVDKKGDPRIVNESGLNMPLLTIEDRKLIMDRERVRVLERSLATSKMREQYARIVPWFKSDKERIEFLTITSVEERQIWINKKGIWNRSNLQPTEMKSLIETQDIAIGMPLEYVRKAWGEPQAIEFTGNPIYKNERWKYLRTVTLPDGFKPEKRYVYFEGGKVVGWETE